VGNDAATTSVRIGLLPHLTVVVGLAAAATGNAVGPESSIANVLLLGKMSGMKRSHQHFIALSNADPHFTIAGACSTAIFCETPVGGIME